MFPGGQVILTASICFCVHVARSILCMDVKAKEHPKAERKKIGLGI